MNNLVLENATKALQSADLLLQDLKSLNISADGSLSEILAPELELITNMKLRLELVLLNLKE